MDSSILAVCFNCRRIANQVQGLNIYAVKINLNFIQNQAAGGSSGSDLEVDANFHRACGGHDDVRAVHNGCCRAWLNRHEGLGGVVDLAPVHHRWADNAWVGLVAKCVSVAGIVVAKVLVQEGACHGHCIGSRSNS